MLSRTCAAIRPFGRAMAGMAFIGLVLFGMVHPASAKGPISAIITGPGIEQPLELIDPARPDRMAKLMEQTGLWYGTGDLPRSIEGPPGELGPAYTLIWVNGGPTELGVEERTIRQVIYLEAEGGPLIHTPLQDSLQGWGLGVTGWFAAPAGLPDTLAGMGVPISSRTSSIVTALPAVKPGVYLALAAGGLVLLTGMAGLLFTRRNSCT